MDVSGRGGRRVADHAARRRRRDVSDAAPQRRRRARRKDRTGVLDLPPSARSDADRLLRREQPRAGDCRRHAVHGHARRAPRGDRREERAAALDDESGREQRRLLGDARPARRQGQSHRRRRRRGVRHSRLRCRLRREKRQGSLALLHHSRPGRSRASTVAAVRAVGCSVLRCRRLEAWRRLGLGDRLVRSRAQSHVLGSRQRRSGLERGSAARRQPVHRLGRRA